MTIHSPMHYLPWHSMYSIYRHINLVMLTVSIRCENELPHKNADTITIHTQLGSDFSLSKEQSCVQITTNSGKPVYMK